LDYTGRGLLEIVPKGNDVMGQAKLRGDYELRKAQAIERKKLEDISKTAKKEYEAKLRAQYLAENPVVYSAVKRRNRDIERARLMLSATMGIALASM
jgi:hypothetical protein